jgi:hypothetical protein
MTKDFKIARRPGQTSQEGIANKNMVSQERAEPEVRTKASRVPTGSSALADSPTTRKTIEVPKDYFFKVKMRAFERKIREKDMWAEILEEYFRNHPTL